MPKDQQKRDTPRQRPVSCRLCRTRKLRCSRQAPCTNCVSRGVRCDLETPILERSSTSPGGSESEILTRLQRLEALLVARKTEQEDNLKKTPDKLNPDHPESQAQLPRPSDLSPRIQGLANDVAWLEGIYTGQGTCPGKIPSPKAVFRICPIKDIPRAESFVYQPEFLPTTSVGPSRCIWLPQYAEAQILVGKYLRDVNRFHHVIHVPSLSSIVEEVYTSLNHQGPVKSGHVILLLSIFASATHCWIQQDCEYGLFSVSTEANDQAPLWVKSTLDVVDVAQRSTSVLIEGVQGIIVISFVLGNLEGISRRCLSLYSVALVLARDLGLHRIDHPSNAHMANTAHAEMGRRVWWYLCACDWMKSTMFTGISENVYSCHPRQMITKKPLNINDEDIFDGMSRAEQPLSQPTSISYTLQRIRLAEVCRHIVDRSPLIMADSGGLSRDDVMDIDTELQMLINDIPPFFSMPKAKLIETYGLSQAQATDILHQRHILYFLIYTQRCKIHIPYFARGSVDPAYSSSRDMCVKHARLIIRSEFYTENTELSTSIQYKFTGLLLGIFMSSIVLLMDLCINPSSPLHEKQRGEIAEAFRILNEAKNVSETANKFVDSLMHILRKHKMCPLKLAPTQKLQAPFGGEIARGIPYTQAHSAFNGSPLSNVPSNVLAVSDNSSMNMEIDGSLNGEDLSSYFHELAENFEQGIDVGSFDWNNIFSDLDSSFI